MNPINIISSIAIVCSTLSFLPQVVKAIKTKKTKDISLLMCVIVTIGISSWLIYGLLIGDAPLIIANAIAIVMIVTLLALKIRYG